MLRFSLAAVALLVAASPALSQDKGRKVAFLVGVGAFKHGLPDLNGLPQKDAAALARVLKAGGFDDVVALTDKDATKDAIEAKFKGVVNGGGNRANALGKGDVLLVAICTHGFTLPPEPGKPAEPFVAGFDAKANDPSTMVALNALIDVPKTSGATCLFLIDACREEPDPNRGRGIEPTKATLPKGTAVLFACSQGQLSQQNDKLGHGLFTYAVLKSLQPAAGGRVSWNKLVTGVEEAFDSAEFRGLIPKGKAQTPVLATGELGTVELLAARDPRPDPKKPDPKTPDPKKAEAKAGKVDPKFTAFGQPFEVEITKGNTKEGQGWIHLQTVPSLPGERFEIDITTKNGLKPNLVVRMIADKDITPNGRPGNWRHFEEYKGKEGKLSATQQVPKGGERVAFLILCDDFVTLHVTITKIEPKMVAAKQVDARMVDFGRPFELKMVRNLPVGQPHGWLYAQAVPMAPGEKFQIEIEEKHGLKPNLFVKLVAAKDVNVKGQVNNWRSFETARGVNGKLDYTQVNAVGGNQLVFVIYCDDLVTLHVTINKVK